MKRVIALFAAAAACAALAVPAFGATKTVKVGPRFKFGPSRVSISRGDTLNFRWTGGLQHNVRITRGPVRTRISKVRSKGTVPFTFRRAGTYTVVCDVHAPTMKMTVRVR